MKPHKDNDNPAALQQGSKVETRILRRLCEKGAYLIVSPELKKAVVMRKESQGSQTRIAVADSKLVGSMVLKDWLHCSKRGRVACYRITHAGRAALKRMIATERQ
ncbi:MAG: hypothetical protein GY952_19070 [Rhodobacteraceae bacterium]|nr:hypothetical protein [Paracoccaceae bacterium]